MAETWEWLSAEAVTLIHAMQLRRHGGGIGIRDEGMLLSALARPQNLAAYGEPDAASLAAACAFGIARNHPFVDGNKRTAAVTSVTFVNLNGHETKIEEGDLVLTFLKLAAGDLEEDELAAWFRGRIAE